MNDNDKLDIVLKNFKDISFPDEIKRLIYELEKINNEYVSKTRKISFNAKRAVKKVLLPYIADSLNRYYSIEDGNKITINGEECFISENFKHAECIAIEYLYEMPDVLGDFLMFYENPKLLNYNKIDVELSKLLKNIVRTRIYEMLDNKTQVYDDYDDWLNLKGIPVKCSEVITITYIKN